MTFCLNRNITDKLKFNIRNMTPEQLYNLGTEGRRTFFEKHVGLEAAKKINTVFEQSLLKNSQKFNLSEWANQIKEPAIKKTVLDKIEGMTELLTPANEKAFLGDLIERKLGVAVKSSDAANLVKLSQEATKSKEIWENKIEENKGDLKKYLKTNPKERYEYGDKVIAFKEYMEILSGKHDPIKTMLKERVKEFKATWEDNPMKAIGDLTLDTLRTVADTSVASVSSWDNSFSGRQGWFTLGTHPTKFWDGVRQSFVTMYGTLRGKRAHEAFLSHIYSDPRYLSGEYKKAGIFKNIEEQYPTSLPERIPFAGRAFNATELAFRDSGFAMRKGVYDMLSDRYTKKGIDMLSGNEAESMGQVVNSTTLKGKWGKTGAGPFVRLIMWAPDILKGQLDVMTAHGLGAGLKTKSARIEAFKNIGKLATEAIVIANVANALWPGSAETNPINSNYGTVKLGKDDTPWDYTAGSRHIIIFVARMITGESESGKGKQIDISEPGYGKRTRYLALVDFFTGKTNPPMSVFRDWTKGQFFGGEDFNWLGAIKRAYTPMFVQQILERDDLWDRITNLFKSVPKPIKKELTLGGIAEDVVSGAANWMGASSVDYKPWPKPKKKKPILFK